MDDSALESRLALCQDVLVLHALVRYGGQGGGAV